MKAEVIKINTNGSKTSGNGKTLTGIQFVYQGDEYQGRRPKPTDRLVFNNSPIAPALKSGEIKEGDWVDITFDQSQYKNPESIKKIDPPAPKETPKPSGGVNRHHQIADMKYNERMKVLADVEEEKQIRIARSTALKGATDVVLHSAKKTEAPEIVAEKILEVSRVFESYLKLEDGMEEITSSMESVSGKEPEFEQEDFRG